MKELIRDQLDQCWKHLDKLLVFWCFLLTMGVAIFFAVWPRVAEGTLDWSHTLAASVFSLFAGLVGGIEIGKRQVPGVLPEPAPAAPTPPAPQVTAARVDLAAPPPLPPEPAASSETQPPGGAS